MEKKMRDWTIDEYFDFFKQSASRVWYTDVDLGKDESLTFLKHLREQIDYIIEKLEVLD